MKMKFIPLLALAAVALAPLARAQSTPPVLINNVIEIDVSDGTIAGTFAPLVVDSFPGALDYSITSGGTNYSSANPPYIQITGGGGENAAALPIIDDATGEVVGLDFTNNGTAYIGNPTITFVGGFTAISTTSGTPPVTTVNDVASSGAVAMVGLSYPNTTEGSTPFFDFPEPDQNESYGPAGYTILMTSLASGTQPAAGFTYSYTVNGLSVGETDGSLSPGTPGSIYWTPPLPGIYSIISTTSDGNGNTAVSPAIRYFALGTAIVSSEAGGNASSAPGTIVPSGSSISLQAASTVKQGFVKQVDFYTDWNPAVGTTGPGGTTGPLPGSGTLIGSSYAYPYNVIYTPELTPTPTHLVKAVAWDNYGNWVQTYATPTGVFQDQIYVTAAAANPLALPTCVIVSPSANSLVEMPGSGGMQINVSAGAGSEAPAGTNISKVELYINGVLLSTDTTAPYNFTWTPTVTGIYKLVALAYDNAGNVVASTSGPSGQTPQDTVVTIESAPTVAITAPSASASLSNGSTVTVKALVTDTNLDQNGNPATITEVQFYQSGNLVGTATTPASTNGSSAASGATYQVTFFPTASGGNGSITPSTLTAVATDNLGFIGTSPGVSVSVNNTQASGSGTVIVNPGSENLPVGSSVVLEATSTPTTGSLQQIDYYTDWNPAVGTTGQAVNGIPSGGSVTGSGTYLGTSYSSPFSVIYTPSGGTGTTHVVKALAWSNSGSYIPGIAGEDEITLTMATAASDGNAPTTCSIVTPTNDSFITLATIPVTVSAGTGSLGSITQVQLYVNGSLFATDTAFPYTFSYVPTVAGVYSFTALAYDNHGNVIASSTNSPSTNVPSPTVVTVETTPAVAILSPANGATLVTGAATTMQAVVRDTNLDGNGNPVTVTAVNFYQDGVLVGTATAPVSGSTYQVTFLASPGASVANGVATSLLSVTATDSVGISGTSPVVTVTTTGSGAGGQIGTTIVSPASSNVAVGSAVAIIASSVPASGSIQQIDFYTDWNPAVGTTGRAVGGVNAGSGPVAGSGTYLGSSYASPYSVIYAPAGASGATHVVKAVAWDSSGNPVPGVGTLDQITLSMVNAVAGSEVSCQIATPANNSEIQISPTGFPVTVDATTSGTGLISKVELYLNGSLFATSSSYPYTFTVVPTATGNYSLIAIAYDNYGNSVASSSSATYTNTPVPTTVTVTAAASGTGTVIIEPTSNNVAVGSSVVLEATSAPTSGTLRQIDYYTDWNASSGTTGEATLSGPTTGSVTGSGTYIGSSYGAPYSVIYTPQGASGTGHLVKALAWSSTGAYIQGVSGKDEIELTLVAAAPTGSQTSCTIISPANGAVATIGPIEVTASAAAGSAGVITKVELYVDGALYGTDTGYPYTFVFTPTSPGVYSLTALAYDSLGNVVASNVGGAAANAPAPTNVTVNAAPDVTITSPSAGSALVSGAAATVTATVVDTNLNSNGSPVSISSVAFYQDGTLVGTATAPIAPGTYQVTFIASAGASGPSSILTATVTDSAGITGTSAGVSVTVSGTASGGQIGTLITSPASGSVPVGSAVVIAATSLPGAGAIQQIDYYTDWNAGAGTTSRSGSAAGSPTVAGSGTYLGTVSSSPYSLVYVPAGPAGSVHVVKVIAWTNSGGAVPGVGTEDTVTLTMVTPVSGSELTCNIASPLNNAQIPISEGIQVTVNASTNSTGLITQVELYVNGGLYKTLATYPYTFSYTPASTGTYELTAIAFDNHGNSVASSSSSTASSTPAPTIVTVTTQSTNTAGTYIQSPTNGAVAVGSSVVITATSGVANGSVEQIDFYTDWNPASGTTGRYAGSGQTTGPVVGSGTYIGTSYGAPYSVIYTPSGAAGATHLVKAVAWSNSGNPIPGIGTEDEITVSLISAESGGLPTCTILSPTPGTLVEIGAIPVSVIAGTGSAGEITQVQLYVNGALYATASSYPYSFTFTPTVTGVFSLQALAYDNRGNVIASNASGTTGSAPSPTVITVESTPTVVVTSPSPNAVLTAGLPTVFSAVASDTNLDQNGNPALISEVLFYQDGNLVGIATSPTSGNTYQTSFLPALNTVSGETVPTSVLTAVAVDSLGFTGTSSNVTVGVSGSATGGQIGTVIVSPAPGTVPIGSSTVITATSTAASGLVQRVEFYTDWNSSSGTGTKLGTSYAAPYSVVYTPSGPAGKVHLVKAMAYDNNGDYISSINNQDEVALTMINPVSGGLPTCLITSPSTGALIEIPDYVDNASAFISVNVSAGATATGEITQVQLYVNGALYATDTVYPYTFKFVPKVTGPYTLTALAYDNHGNVIASSTQTTYTNVPPATLVQIEAAPSVDITSPGSGAVLNSGAPTSIQVSATDTNLDQNGNPVSITQVQFFQDGAFVGEASQPTTGNIYTTSFKPTQAFLNGVLIPSELTAVATDSLGFTGTSPAIEVTVTAGGTGSNVVIGTPPTATLNFPTNGENVIVNTPVTFSASGYAANGNIQSVSFLVNGAVVATVTSYPYTATYTFANLGFYQVEADVVDNVGDKTSSTIAKINVVAEPPPVVSISSPANGTLVTAGNGVTVTASATSPNGTIASVQFFSNGISIGTSTSAPYTVTFTPTSPGLYAITALATDNAGEQTTSASSYIDAVPSTTNQGATVYTGTYTGVGITDNGRFSFAVVDGTIATYIGHTGSSPDTASGGTPQFYSDIAISPGDTFATANLYGTASGSGISATLLPGNELAIGTSTGAADYAVASGLYSGSISGLASSQVTAIVGSDGSIMAYVSNAGYTDVADGTVGSVATNGAFSLTTILGNTFSGTVSPTTGFLTGKLTGPSAGTVLAARVSGGTFSDGVMANISTRGSVGTGANVMIAGFVVGGTANKQILVRAVGPTLSSYGVTSGLLANPQLQVFNSAGVLIAANTGWGSQPSNAITVAAADTQVGAFALPSGSADSALVATFAPGPYTAVVSGVGGSSGIALVEAYDMSTNIPFTPNRLLNVSTRGTVGTGNSVMIAGFVVNGTAPKLVLIRGVGPTLSSFGITSPVATPHLQLFDVKGNLLRENYTWQSGNDPTLTANAATSAGAFALPANSADSSILIVLPPGTYTAELSGANSATGVGLVEVYEVP
jgi:hypothetical protein